MCEQGWEFTLWPCGPRRLGLRLHCLSLEESIVNLAGSQVSVGFAARGSPKKEARLAALAGSPHAVLSAALGFSVCMVVLLMVSTHVSVNNPPRVNHLPSSALRHSPRESTAVTRCVLCVSREIPEASYPWGGQLATSRAALCLRKLFLIL